MKTKYLANGDLAEATIQKTVVAWCKSHPKLARVIMHFPNEGKRTWYYGKLLQTMGMRAGVSDLFVAMARHEFIGAWIELKSAKGIVSSAQKEFLEDMRQQGYFTAVCRSIDECINTLTWYCF